jgi:hypothetical protein
MTQPKVFGLDFRWLNSSLMRSFDSYMGFLVHANSHKLREKLHQQFWQWVKEYPRQTKKGQP